jgi:hypothetical protein
MVSQKEMENFKKILLYMPSSRMSEEEKTMWFSLLPHMKEIHISKLAQLLEQEAKEVVDVRLKNMNLKNAK